MEKYLLKMIGIITALLLSSCSSVSIPTLLPSNAFTPHSTSSYHASLWEGSPETIWEKLQHTSSAHLATMQSNDPEKTAWIQLALINKRNSLNTPQLVRGLLVWREQHPLHPANQLLPSNATLNDLLSSPPPQHIALLLPQNGAYATPGQMIREGFLSAYYSLAKTGKQSVKFYDTTQGNVAALYQRAISEGADFVVGPLIKENVQQLSRTMSFPVPTLALNYTEGWLPSNFYEFGLLPEDEAAQIASRARLVGQSSAIIIAPQTPWGNRIVSSFITRWQALGGSVRDSLYYTSQSNLNQDIAHLLNVNPDRDQRLMQEKNNKKALTQQRRHDFDVIFLFSQPQQARVIVPLLKYYYASDIPIYATSAVYSGSPNPAKDVDLNGVIICDIPWHKKGQTGLQSRLYAVGQDAYLLSQALSRLLRLPNFPIYGKTGALTLSTQHQVHRSLPCTAIQNGLL